MRKAQKQYFKTRNYNDLQRSKQLESEIDNEIKRALEVEKTKEEIAHFIKERPLEYVLKCVREEYFKHNNQKQ